MFDLTTDAIARALTTYSLGRQVLCLRQASSTNDIAHEQACAGAPDGLLVIADMQTAGRGRLGRSWWAPPGACLLMSLVLRPPIAVRHAGQLTMCLGLAAVEGIEASTGLHAALKWPNDVTLNGRKLGGMLSELQSDGNRLAYAVLGLGLNVNVAFGKAEGVPASQLPPAEIAANATSLLQALGRPVARVPLLAVILARCEAWYDRLLAGESPHEAWAARLETLGRPVSVATHEGAWRGVATGVTTEGALLVRDEAGSQRVVWGGDVTRLGHSA